MQDTKDQLIAIYESHDDVKRMGELENGVKFLQATCKTQQQEIKQIITDIIDKNSKLEPQTKRSEPVEDHQKRICHKLPVLVGSNLKRYQDHKE